MKKLITLILILVLALPAAAGAEDTDPIVGCWYSLYDKSVVPEMAPLFDDMDYNVTIFFFASNGSVYALVNQIKDYSGSPLFGPMGKWEKKDGIYSYNLMALGSGSCYMDDDGLWLNVNDMYDVNYKKMDPFSPYTGYRYK